MKKIKIEKWKVKTPEGKEAEETILTVLNALILGKRPEDIPKGYDGFRMFNRLHRAFESAEKTGTLELEGLDYKFLREIIENDIPSIWGISDNISKAIEEFMSLK